MSCWTEGPDGTVELLKKLWSDGLSASQIAGELGGMTRNAVIGKVHRLGLSGRAKASSTSPRPRKARSSSHIPRVPRGPFQGSAALAYDYYTEPEPELLEKIIPLQQRRTLLELTEVTCRWPVGDPGSGEFFFCGGETAGATYCTYHARMACQPQGDRRRDHRPYRY